MNTYSVPLALDGFQINDRAVRRFDRFDGAALNEYWTVDQGTDNAVLVAGIEGGRVALVTGVDINDSSILSGALNMRCDRGPITLVWRVRIDTELEDKALFVGIHDNITTDEMPFAIDGSDVITGLAAADSVGFIVDDAALTKRWAIVANKAGTVHSGSSILGGGTLQDGTSLTPTAGTYQNLALHINELGDVQFYINDLQVGSLKAAITTTVLTALMANLDTAGATAETADISLAFLEYHIAEDATVV